MKKITAILFLFAFMAYSGHVEAQTGGRKGEKRIRIKSRRRGDHILTQYKSHGHADEFARGSSGRRGRFAKLFYRAKPSWRVHKTNNFSNNRDNRDLFTRFRQKGHMDNSETQSRQNFDRNRKRDHGSRSFKSRKYQRNK